MDITTIVTFFGGLAIFLFGMSSMRESLERVSGDKLERALSNMSGNIVKGVLLGIVITIAVQSSSATTVMVVGFVNSGMLSLSQATSVIIGANVGTTFTSWIFSLSGIDSENNPIVSLLKPSSLGYILAIIGVIMILFISGRKRKNIGVLFVSLGMLMLGLTIMGDAMEPLSKMPQFATALTYFKNPLLGFLVGLGLTAIIQASSASIGILQKLVDTTGEITYGMTIPLLLGMHIGTCVTAMISSVGATTNGKRAALIHLYFNVIKSVILMVVYQLLVSFVGRFAAFSDTIVGSSAQVALLHTLFSVFGAVIMIGFTKQLAWLAIKTVPDKKNVLYKDLPDEKFLSTPVVAIGQSKQAVKKMTDISKNNILTSLDLILQYDGAAAQKIIEREDIVDTFEDKLSSYLVKISEANLGTEESRDVAKMLHVIGDFERISDHALNIENSAEEINDKKIVFSQKAKDELTIMLDAIREMIEITFTSYLTEDILLASTAEPLEQVIDELKSTILNNHIDRIQSGECTIKNGFILNDIVTNLERVSDHCSNIAACIIRSDKDFDFHEYLERVKSNDNKQYVETFETYENKYLYKINQ